LTLSLRNEEPRKLPRCNSYDSRTRSFRGRGPELDELAAIAQAQQGDVEAFASLVRQYQEIAFRTAYLIVRDDAEAQDVTQEAFLRAYRGLSRFDRHRSFRPWLLRIVTNEALNKVRSARRRDARMERYGRDTAAARHVESPEGELEQMELARRVWQAVGTLNHEEQTVLYLQYFLDVPQAEAAAVIGRPIGTVKSRLHRALKRLRSVIEERYPDLAPPPRTPDGPESQR